MSDDTSVPNKDPDQSATDAPRSSAEATGNAVLANVLYKRQSPPRAVVPPTPLGGAVGAGIALVILPAIVLFVLAMQFRQRPESMPSVLVLAMVAVFGIMMLLGALALVSTLFARLGISDPSEAMGLPPGSARAFIALALIVLFALIAVMLYVNTNQTYRIDGLSDEQRANLVKDPHNLVTAIVGHTCAASEPGCAPGSQVYTAYLRQDAGSQSADLAKQLLILIGTLMTSVTSYYFASRAGEASAKTAITALATHLTGKVADDEDTKPDPSPKPDLPSPVNDQEKKDGGDGNDEHDGCHGAGAALTEDKDLPASTGGVTK